MIKKFAQLKALIRATDLSDRLDLLTDITLENEDEQIIRFCENYRWILGASDRRKTKKALGGVSGKRKTEPISIKKDGDEIYREEK
jgi:hypothetical protein